MPLSTSLTPVPGDGDGRRRPAANPPARSFVMGLNLVIGALVTIGLELVENGR
jgi:hypothetical protein